MNTVTLTVPTMDIIFHVDNNKNYIISNKIYNSDNVGYIIKLFTLQRTTDKPAELTKSIRLRLTVCECDNNTTTDSSFTSVDTTIVNHVRQVNVRTLQMHNIRKKQLHAIST